MSHEDIVKKYGKGVLMDASFLLEEKKTIIPVSPALDIPLGGGVTEGTVMTLSGKAGSGKSSTALQIASNAQKPEFGSRKIFYNDVEHRLKKSNLQGIHGLDFSKEKFQIIRSAKDKILSAEDHLNIDLDILKTEPNCVLIIDSASALCGLGEMTEDVKGDFRNNGPKLIANFCRHIAPLVLLNKSIVIITQHMIADTSGKSMSPYHEDGGNKIQHQSDIRMRIKYTDKWEVGSGDNAKRVGQVLHWQIMKSPFGPHDKIESYLRYGYGLDDITENINFACDLGLITKGGSWFTLEWTGEKFQGQEKIYQILYENKKLYQELLKKIKEVLV